MIDNHCTVILRVLNCLNHLSVYEIFIHITLLMAEIFMMFLQIQKFAVRFPQLCDAESFLNCVRVSFHAWPLSNCVQGAYYFTYIFKCHFSNPFSLCARIPFAMDALCFFIFLFLCSLRCCILLYVAIEVHATTHCYVQN